ncbi:MAG: isopentenyl-diphosphate Delta-isomerase [Rothia sp. (in: high G+C Gram-positive bacteria)]|nr:isopentenyl-diphosphate Delta-isomerase [Rothia sp. (in: high G+C Gram-positive bacteria)]
MLDSEDRRCDVEEVVLVDEQGKELGFARKSEVHTRHTPLHLAFSCYLVNDQGQILVSRRALEKKTWPGVWTNSFCGHPGRNEATTAAVIRRAAGELGTSITALRLALPDFRYRAVDASGIVENELCPVFIANVTDTLRPNPAEVAEWSWVDRTALVNAARSTPFAFSPWMVLQLPQMDPILAQHENKERAV